ncbi:MAG TPA: hypothetical protein VN429_11065, partial [Methanospirillum sp.]|uniref:hypothetical protein n=1 Tax=Methanospirillum sp. TaxID=45200 RepID=UPI002CAADDC6
MNPVTKEEVISLLTKLHVSNIGALTDPEITVESIISNLAKYRIFVPEIFFSTLADRLGLEYIEKEAIVKTLDLGCMLPYTVEEGALILLLESKPAYVRVATANPLDNDLFKRLEDVFHKKIEKVVVSIDTVISMSDGCYEAPHAYSALNELVDRQPEESAYRILIPWQKGAILLFILLMALLIVYN